MYGKYAIVAMVLFVAVASGGLSVVSMGLLPLSNTPVGPALAAAGGAFICAVCLKGCYNLLFNESSEMEDALPR